MTEAPTEAWARAYAAQARSDWQVYKALQFEARQSACHELHFLQMACEKIAKAYRLRDDSVPLEKIRTEHVGCDKFLKNYLKSSEAREFYRGRPKQLEAATPKLVQLMKQIQALCPAIDSVACPTNVEYPWEDGSGRVIAPCEHRFLAPDLTTAQARTLLKIIERALERF